MVFNPRLGPACVLFRSGNEFPIGRKDQARTRICQFHTVARRFPNIKEKRPLDSMLCGPVSMCFPQEQIGRA